jgi:hypothetical protein
MARAQVTGTLDIARPEIGSVWKISNAAPCNESRGTKRKHFASHQTTLEPPSCVPDTATPNGHGSGKLCIGVPFESVKYPGNPNCKNPRVGRRSRHCLECRTIFRRYQCRRSIARIRRSRAAPCNESRGTKRKHFASQQTTLEPPSCVPGTVTPNGHGSGKLCIGVPSESVKYPGNPNCKNPRVGKSRQCESIPSEMGVVDVARANQAAIAMLEGVVSRLMTKITNLENPQKKASVYGVCIVPDAAEKAACMSPAAHCG